jgi:hypothetical protein
VPGVRDRLPPYPKRYEAIFGRDAAIVLTHLLNTPPVLMAGDEFVFVPDITLYSATHLRSIAQDRALRILERRGVVTVRDDGDGRFICVNVDALEAVWRDATDSEESAA